LNKFAKCEVYESGGHKFSANFRVLKEFGGFPNFAEIFGMRIFLMISMNFTKSAISHSFLAPDPAY
jgi:hypothetical protein